MYDNSGAANDNGEGGQPSPSADSTQFDYLINENRRLQSIIDQYKYWEANYYANASAYGAPFNSNGDLSAAAGQESASQTSSQQLPDPLTGVQQQTLQSTESSSTKEVTSQETLQLRKELDSLRKEQEDLITLLADQDLKMQKYVRQLKDLGQEVSLPIISPECIVLPI